MLLASGIHLFSLDNFLAPLSDFFIIIRKFSFMFPLPFSLIKLNLTEYHQVYILVCLGSHKKYHRLGGLNNRNSFYPSFGGWKSKIMVPTGLVFGGASLPESVDDCLLTVSSHDLFLCVHTGWG